MEKPLFLAASRIKNEIDDLYELLDVEDSIYSRSKFICFAFVEKQKEKKRTIRSRAFAVDVASVAVLKHKRVFSSAPPLRSSNL